MAKIVAKNVCVEFPVVCGGRSLRHAVMKTAQRIGGRMVGDETSSLKIVRGLEDVSFVLNGGDRLGLIGSNGAGKTTLIRTLAGIYEPSSGDVHLEGRLLPMFDIGVGFDDEASGYENIYLRGLIMGLNAKQIAARMDEIAEYSELGDYLDLPVRTYSSGMSLRLMFAIATSLEGDIVLMDEWIAVGDADFRRKTNERLRRITSSSGIVVLASHDTSLLKQVCNLGMRLEASRICAFGPIDDVLAEVESSVKNLQGAD